MKKNIRIAAFFASVLALGAIGSSANAQSCVSPYTMNVTGPQTISFDSSLPVGSILWTRKAMSGSISGGPCTGGTFTMTHSGTGPYLGNNLYATAVPGIAYRLRLNGPVCSLAWWPMSCSGNWIPGMVVHELLMELVKTGPIIVGGTLSGIFGAWDTSNRVRYAQYGWAAPVVVIPTNPTCAVSTPSVSVPLGSVSARAFNGIGSTSSAIPFNIALNCTGGDPGSTIGVHLTLTDQAQPTNISDTLSLTPDSTASGVGIQTLTGTTVIRYGADSSAAGNPNQWFAGNAAAGVFNIPLTSRYIQTGATIAPGSANGRATFTMSYQ